MEFASLTGHRIVVTGASSGIGRAIALACAQAGADLVVTCRKSVEQLQEAAQEITALDVACEAVQLDVRDAAGREQFQRDCLSAGPVHAVVNNAGVDLLTGAGRDLGYEEKLRELFEVDVVGTLALSRGFGHHMQQQGRGVILNIGWDQSDRGMGGDSGELFATAKNAIMGFTRSLAVSLAPAVRVNCIAPGWIQTAWGDHASPYWQQRVLDETPLRRWGLPADIASMARFLLSDEAAFITGQVINVNGGAVR
jgi:3-oxoacyl-[acyl-carrier protein] reductase